MGDVDLPNRIIIPRLTSDPDIRVAGTHDDEFDGTSSANPPTGWTSIGALPDACDVNTTILSHLYIKANAGGSKNMKGFYKAILTPPFTMTARLSGTSYSGNYNQSGILLGDSGPTNLLVLAVGSDSSGRWSIVPGKTTRTTWNNALPGYVQGGVGAGPHWLRFKVNSSTSVDVSYSGDGYIYSYIALAYNPSFTIANMGLYVNSESATWPCEAAFDWVRFS